MSCGERSLGLRRGAAVLVDPRPSARIMKLSCRGTYKNKCVRMITKINKMRQTHYTTLYRQERRGGDRVVLFLDDGTKYIAYAHKHPQI